VYPNWLTEPVYVHYNEQQEWYYYPGQRPDELLLFKSVDWERGLNAGTIYPSPSDTHAIHYGLRGIVSSMSTRRV
jgi:hypothetical protein